VDEQAEVFAEAYNRRIVSPRVIQQRREEFLRQVPPKCRGVFRQAYTTNNAIKAIRAKCYECCGYSYAEVDKCTAVTCPLWRFRHGHHPTTAGRRGKST